MISAIHPKYFHRLSHLLVVAFLAFTFSNHAYAKKIYNGVCGSVYLNSGDSIIADGNQLIKIPVKNKKLEIIENAYTHNNKIEKRLDPGTVDSVILWPKTTPERPHTFMYIKGRGWCWQAERSPYLSVYCYSPKGYSISGNGGLWMKGKSKMLVIKNGKEYDFGEPQKKCDKKMRAMLENILADDPNFIGTIANAKGRRDKVLRSLVLYNPNKSAK